MVSAKISDPVYYPNFLRKSTKMVTSDDATHLEVLYAALFRLYMCYTFYPYRTKITDSKTVTGKETFLGQSEQPQEGPSIFMWAANSW